MESSKSFKQFSQYRYKEKWQWPCVVTSDRSDFTFEAEKKVNDKEVYKDVNLGKDLIRNLTRKSNRLFKSLKDGD